MGPIGIGWIGEAEPDPVLLGHVERQVARVFHVPVQLFTPSARPRHALDPRRNQHASGEILRWLLPLAPPGGKVLGITDQDLFIPILTYVFGEAQLSGTAAVVSTARLKVPLGLSGARALRERMAKEAIHELGHCYGLRHCGGAGCVMGRSSSVREVDEKGQGLCRECRVQLPGHR